MTNEENSSPQKPEKVSHRVPPLLSYLIILFSIAFLLLFLSYTMQQRQSDQEVIEGLQQNTSAMQSVHALIEQNNDLRNQLAQLEEDYESLETQTQAQLEESQNRILAMDWLWRIEREVLQRRYSAARTMVTEFEATGLKEYLPSTSLVDPDYRTPLEQYESMYDQLF